LAKHTNKSFDFEIRQVIKLQWPIAFKDIYLLTVIQLVQKKTFCP